MLSQLAKNASGAPAEVVRRFRLIWKNPDTGRNHQVGAFEALADGRYAFAYEPDAGATDGFTPLAQFPDLSAVYVSPTLPAFLANRVMTKRRESIEQYMGWLGLPTDAQPAEVLARTGGTRATDSLALAESFEPVDGLCVGHFFVAGIQHAQAMHLLDHLEVGQELCLKNDQSNEYNPRALLITADGEKLGWVPNWLVTDIHQLREDGSVQITVEQLNHDAPSHLKVLCKLVATSS